MQRKILCYDLHGANSDDYNEVYDYIEKRLNGTRATESAFIFFSDRNNKELRDEFVTKFGKNVSLLINDFPCATATWRIKDSEKWLNK